ncbi:hypothetical protein DM02DRAFT_58764 [Periconia macrospinosa]|uniref:DUF676 domain-containing protein n=1 Tax=Periconia macrospinosa TaxID=97972 RepID=A0A2V1DIW3_9PLEO|nr:hypothetical protein DM02DRAFT_58764 [Periconia macrospinosa]
MALMNPPLKTPKTTLLPPQAPVSPSHGSSSNSPSSRSKPIPYTGSPLALCASDIRLFFQNAWSIPGIMRPIHSASPTPLDELYPSGPNILALVLHAFLLVFEAGFLVSLPLLAFVPVWAGAIYLVVVGAVVWDVSGALNGTVDTKLSSKVRLEEREVRGTAGECWVYLNGVSIGHHWMQSNLDRLSYTFRRPIIGVHNRTYGIIFDLIQCIIERNFCYATADIRRSYAVIREKLLDPKYTKLILIAHSQGGIEGSLILDWLLGELPQDIIHKLEIYTFGSAANHFNNPLRESKSENSAHAYAVRHIEHYTHAGEFVARWGAITFSRMENRYMGRIFIQPGSGHLLNQHYLTDMFPLDKNMRVVEENKFMNMPVEIPSHRIANGNTKDTEVESLLDGVEGNTAGSTVKDFSRLWGYRNGRTPAD